MILVFDFVYSLSFLNGAGGYTVIATKAISSLITQGIFVMFTYWVFYLMIVVLLVTGVLQIRYLQAALQCYDSTVSTLPSGFFLFSLFFPFFFFSTDVNTQFLLLLQAVIPTQFVMFTMFAIISGGVLYDDFAGMAPLNVRFLSLFHFHFSLDFPSDLFRLSPPRLCSSLWESCLPSLVSHSSPGAARD